MICFAKAIWRRWIGRGENSMGRENRMKVLRGFGEGMVGRARGGGGGGVCEASAHIPNLKASQKIN